MDKKQLLYILLSLFIANTSLAEISVPRQIADRPAAHCQSPRWSPDGLQLAYDVFHPKKDAREIWIMKFNPKMRKSQDDIEVTAGRSRSGSLLGEKKPPIVDFEWASDMKILNNPYVFSSIGLKKNFDLYADGTWLTKNSGNDGQPAWSPDGRYIAYTSQQKNSGDIYLIDLAGDSDESRWLTQWPNATEFHPRWAYNKNYLIFTKSESGKYGQDIGLILDIARPKETTKLVTHWESDEIRPSWSPNNQKIAFYSNKDNQNDKIFDLWVIDIDGANPKKLAKDIVVDDHHGAVWSSDSKTIFFVKKDFKKDDPIMYVNIESGKSFVLDTETQLNTDLTIYRRDNQYNLAFTALGQKGSTDKTWKRIYMVTFSDNDLKKE